jgi:hypothetical protein
VVHIYNVRLFDAGQQFLKSTFDANNPDGVDGVIVEYCLFEFTTYRAGVRLHTRHRRA